MLEFSKIEIQSLKEIVCFESVGVKLGIRADNAAFIDKLKIILPDIIPIERKEIAKDDVEMWFSAVSDENLKDNLNIFKESDHIIVNQPLDESLGSLESHIRLTIAEFAKDFVFLHAGAVSWCGKAIIIPGKSFTGKTTLVAELIKRDCSYLSDEYAVIDKNGFVHPFPKKLSIRGIVDSFRQVDFDVEELGGERCEIPVPVGYLLLTEYKEDKKRHRIQINSSGEGIMASVANSISVRQNPKFVLEVLSSVANNATVLHTERGDVKEFADYLLTYLKNLNSEDDNNSINTFE